MNPNRLNKEIRHYLRSKRVTNPINVTLTQRQQFNGFEIDHCRSEQNFRHFKNVLNTKVFGNSYRRFGQQLQMLVIREVSADKRHHLHCIFEQPNRYQFEEFVRLVHRIWRSTNFGYDQIHIEKPSSQQREDGWLNYIMKDRTKVSLDTSIDWTNSTVLNLWRLQSPLISQSSKPSKGESQILFND